MTFGDRACVLEVGDEVEADLRHNHEAAMENKRRWGHRTGLERKRILRGLRVGMQVPRQRTMDRCRTRNDRGRATSTKRALPEAMYFFRRAHAFVRPSAVMEIISRLRHDKEDNTLLLQYLQSYKGDEPKEHPDRQTSSVLYSSTAASLAFFRFDSTPRKKRRLFT